MINEEQRISLHHTLRMNDVRRFVLSVPARKESLPGTLTVVSRAAHIEYYILILSQLSQHKVDDRILYTWIRMTRGTVLKTEDEEQ